MLVTQQKPDLVTQSIRQGVSFILVPVQQKFTSVITQTREFFNVLTSLGKIRAENARLRQELQRLQLDNQRLAGQVQENEVLRQELAYKKATAWKFIPAEIVARDPASWLERAVVNRGTVDGVRPGAGVITPEGVAGRVIAVTSHSATVLLLPDVQSSVAAVVERSRIPGTVKGSGGRWLAMMHVPTGDDVKIQDLVVTSAVSSIFPPGLVLGEIASVQGAENGLMLAIRIKPRVNFQTLDRLLILKPEEE